MHYDYWHLFVYDLYAAYRVALENTFLQMNFSADEILAMRETMLKDLGEYNDETLEMLCRSEGVKIRGGFYAAWSKTKLTWNGKPAGLVKLPCFDGKTLEESTQHYSKAFRIKIYPVSELSQEDSIVDRFGSSTLIVHGKC